MMTLWILVTGVIAITFGLNGLYRVANPRHPIEQVYHKKMIAYSLLTIGGGMALSGYAIFA
jgi:hypothetical protein